MTEEQFDRQSDDIVAAHEHGLIGYSTAIVLWVELRKRYTQALQRGIGTPASDLPTYQCPHL